MYPLSGLFVLEIRGFKQLTIIRGIFAGSSFDTWQLAIEVLVIEFHFWDFISPRPYLEVMGGGFSLCNRESGSIDKSQSYLLTI